jgi:hypothetical protein
MQHIPTLIIKLLGNPPNQYIEKYHYQLYPPQFAKLNNAFNKIDSTSAQSVKHLFIQLKLRILNQQIVSNLFKPIILVTIEYNLQITTL